MPKPKTCAQCGASFLPMRTGQKVCSVDCARLQGREDNQKNKLKKALKEKRASSKRVREYREKNKSMTVHRNEAQRAFNHYIRVRDFGKPCISCGKEMQWHHQGGKGSGIDAGHYRSRGAARHLSFNVFNCAAQCYTCNRFLSGNVNNFRIGLIARFGKHIVDKIENNNLSLRPTKEYYQRVKEVFESRARHLLKLRESH